MSSAARKPYLNLKDSLVEFFERPTRYLKDTITKESAFEKPYLDGEYPSMHLDLPDPDWPTWNFDDSVRNRLGGRYQPKGGAEAHPVRGCPGCALYADPSADCETDPVEIHSGIFCTNTPGAATDRVITRKAKEQTLDTGNWGITERTIGVPIGVTAGDCVLEVYAEVGQIKQVTVGAWATLGPSAAVYVDPALSTHRICGRMVDGAGSVCIACVDVSCCSCTNPPSVFQIDSYDSTIDPGGDAYVTVSGGCGPYTYSVSGTGYTASGTGTTGKITSAAGTCGVNYAPVVTVTVKDSCTTSKTCKIRNTGGQWVIQSYTCGYSVATAPYSTVTVGWTAIGWVEKYFCEAVFEEKKQIHTANYISNTTTCADSHCGHEADCNEYGYQGIGDNCLYVATPWCTSCSEITGPQCWCHRTEDLRYYEWTC